MKPDSTNSSYTADVLDAVQQNGWNLQHVNPALQADKEVVLAAVEKDGRALQYASPALQADKDVVLAAVEKDGRALQYASPTLQADKDVVLAAVRQNGEALKYTDPKLEGLDQCPILFELQEDRDVILFRLRKDREFMLEAVGQNGLALEYANYQLKEDPEVVLAAVKQNGLALQYVTYSAFYSNPLNEDKDVVLAAVRQNGEALQFASDELKKDLEVVLAAVDQNPFAIIYQKDQAIGFTTEEDLQIHFKAFQRQVEILETIPPQELKQYKKLHEQHVKHFEQLSSNNIDCLSRMFAGSKKDPGAIRALLLRNDILKKELNDCLLDCFKIATQYIQGTTQPVIQSSLKETLLTDLPFVKMILHDFTDTQKEKWNGFISFLQTKGLVQDDKLKNLVLTPSQSASSGSAGVFNSLSGLLTPTSKATRPLSGARAPLLEERTGAASSNEDPRSR